MIQSIRKNHYWLWDKEYTNCVNVRSYSTGVNADKTICDWDPGDLVIADLNFDGLDDFGFIYDSGGNGGPLYLFYLQNPEGRFYRNLYLCDSVGLFPTKFDLTRKRFCTYTRANTYQMSIRTYQFNDERNCWYELPRILIDV